MSRKKSTSYASYPTHKVFAAAVHAFNVNGGYFKTNHGESIIDQDGNEKFVAKPRNLDIILELLRSDTELCESVYTKAKEIMEYYQGKLIDLMSGKLNSYSQAACHVANSESVNSPVDIGLIASLPSAYINSVKFDSILEAKERAHAVSKHFGVKGENYQGRVNVISSIFSRKWFRYFHTAQDINTGNVINFSTNDSLEIGKEINVKGRIKDHVELGVTRLNYVKISVDAES